MQGWHADSHKAINNLLEAVESLFIVNVAFDKAILEVRPAPQLVGGTAWTLAKSGFRESFDYLFIDEAGQVSLANTIAMGMCAKNLILLGEPPPLRGRPEQGATLR